MLEELVSSLRYTVDFVEKQVADLTDEEIFLQPSGAPNHAAWTLGHIAFSCHEIACDLGVERWLPDDWESRFGYGSSPARERTRESVLRCLPGRQAELPSPGQPSPHWQFSQPQSAHSPAPQLEH